MARQIVVSWNGASNSFDIGRLSRDKLYGRKRRLVVDEDGNQCLAGMLTEDGSTLLPPAPRPSCTSMKSSTWWSAARFAQ
ncbi:MAG: hypothetical protein GY898_13940 [Proteobacteria bacterium]|nr:hypothetical protein [Pseudomonadota bacterium]